MPQNPARIKVSSWLRDVPFKGRRLTAHSARYPKRKRKNKISTGKKSFNKTFVEINVVPQIKIVSNPDKCPFIALFSIVFSSCFFCFFLKNLPVGAGGQPDKTVKIIGKMALVKKSRPQGCLHRSSSLFQKLSGSTNSDILKVAVGCNSLGPGKCPQQGGFAQSCLP